MLEIGVQDPKRAKITWKHSLLIHCSAFEKTTGFRTVARRYARRSALFESRLLRSPACQNRRPDPPNPAELAATPSTPSEPADRPPTRPATESPADHAIPISLHTGVRLWWAQRTLSTEQMYGDITRRGRGDVARDRQQPCAHAPAPWGVSLT